MQVHDCSIMQQLFELKLKRKESNKLEKEIQNIQSNMIGVKKKGLKEYLDLSKNSNNVFERLAQDQSSRNWRVYVDESPSNSIMNIIRKRNKRSKNSKLIKLRDYHSACHFSPEDSRIKINIMNDEGKYCTPNQLPKKPYYWTNKNRFASTDWIKQKLSRMK